MAAVWTRINTILLMLVLLALLGVMAMLAGGVRGGPLDPTGPPSATDGVRQPGTPISAPTTIAAPGRYYVTRNITMTGPGVVITIAASNVEVDLGGFTLQGNDAGASYGFYVFNPQTDISIRNGTVKDFHFGIDTAAGTRVRIENVHATSNVRGFHLGALNVLTTCTAMQNSETGIYMPGDLSRTTDCTSSDNGGDGIALAGVWNVAERNHAVNNAASDMKDVNELTANTIRNNVVGGINLRALGGAHVVENVCVGGSIVNAAGNDVSGNYFC